MELKVIGYITSKEAELFYDCADRYAYDKSQNKFAISDGVTKSFFPKIWADILVNKWVASKEFDETQFIPDCQKDWLNQVTEIVNKPDAKFFTRNAFNSKKPGLATFIGLRFYRKKKEWFWKAEALGDSFLFFVPKKVKNFSKECIILSSKKEPILFDNFPDYLSSLGDNHKGDKQYKENRMTSGTFYLMTDALAEWFLNEKDNALSKIGLWQNQKDFERFVDEERQNKKLGNDDSAILIIRIEDDRKEGINYIFEDVSDIKELIEVQQKEIDLIEKVKEQELILQEENANSEISTEQTQQEVNVENEFPQEIEAGAEVEAVAEKPKKGMVEKTKSFFSSAFECLQSTKKEEIEIDEIEGVVENIKEEEPSSQEVANSSEIEKPENSKNNESTEVPQLNAIMPNKPVQKITDKF